MAAQQCVPLSTQKKVVVVETKSVPQGIAAMMAVDLDTDAVEITEAMEQAAGRVTTAQITYAARNSNMDGLEIQAGDYLALVGSQLFATDREIDGLLAALAEDAAQRGAEFITLFSGQNVSEEEAQRAQEIFAQRCPEAEVSVIPGGQPVYYYLISME